MAGLYPIVGHRQAFHTSDCGHVSERHLKLLAKRVWITKQPTPPALNLKARLTHQAQGEAGQPWGGFAGGDSGVKADN